MGIPQLNKNLENVNKKIEIKNLKNTTNYNALVNLFGENNQIKNFKINIDLSIVLYKELFSSISYNEVLEKMTTYINNIKQNNNEIKLYSDPDKNTRKITLHNLRSNSKKQMVEQYKKNLKQEISNMKTIDSNIILNQKLIDILNLNNDIILNKITYEEYVEQIEFISNPKNSLILNEETNVLNEEEEKEYNEYQQYLYEMLEDCETVEILEQNEYNEEPVDDNNVVTDDYEAYLLLKKKHEIELRNIFRLFIYMNSFKYHERYILEVLLKNNIILDSELIKSEILDAETYIIKTLKKKQKKQIIVSNDQDVILFGLLHFKKHLYINTKLSNNINDLTIIENNNLTKNIAILTAFFNTTDYFPGITQFCVTPERLEKIKNNQKMFDMLNKSYDDIIELVGIFLTYYYKPKQTYILAAKLTHAMITEYITNFKLYLSLEKEFYVEYKPCKIDINSLYAYIIENQYIRLDLLN